MLSPSLVKQDIGSLGADVLLVALSHVAVVVVVPVVVDLALPVRRVWGEYSYYSAALTSSICIETLLSVGSRFAMYKDITSRHKKLK